MSNPRAMNVVDSPSTAARWLPSHVQITSKWLARWRIVRVYSTDRWVCNGAKFKLVWVPCRHAPRQWQAMEPELV